MPSHLFVLCPPYSGSTILWKLLATSNNVSSMPSEGQFLPELESVMRDKPWVRDNPLPWEEIRRVWQSYWDMDKPVLLEKSPPNIIRAAEIAQHFQPVKFVIMVRNPYAHSEGLMRRNNWTAERAARFSMMCLRTQLENRESLDDTLVLTYETLVADPVAACDELAQFMPDLADMDPQASFEVHSVDGVVDRQITDLNRKKIATLGRASIAAMNSEFRQHEEVLAGWGYDFIDEAGVPAAPPVIQRGWRERLKFW